MFAGADGIFHEAAIVSVPRSVKDLLETHDINCTGTLNVLMAARDCGVKKVVIASSAAVYGNNPELPKRESMKPDLFSHRMRFRRLPGNIIARSSRNSIACSASRCGASMSLVPGRIPHPPILELLQSLSRTLLPINQLRFSVMGNRHGILCM